MTSPRLYPFDSLRSLRVTVFINKKRCYTYSVNLPSVIPSEVEGSNNGGVNKKTLYVERERKIKLNAIRIACNINHRYLTSQSLYLFDSLCPLRMTVFININIDAIRIA